MIAHVVEGLQGDAGPDAEAAGRQLAEQGQDLVGRAAARGRRLRRTSRRLRRKVARGRRPGRGNAGGSRVALRRGAGGAGGHRARRHRGAAASVRRAARDGRAGAAAARWPATPMSGALRLALALAGVGPCCCCCCPSRLPPGPRAPTSSSANRSWPTSRSSRPPSPTCCAPFPSISSTATSPPTPPSPSSTCPLGRHCHYWHVGQEIHDRRDSDALRAFGLGYLCHLSADTVAHNFYVPRQLLLTSSTAGDGPLLLGEPGGDPPRRRVLAKTAKDIIRLDHARGRHSPGPDHRAHDLQRADQPAALPRHGAPDREPRAGSGRRRWPGRTAAGVFADEDVERHLGLSYDFMMELLRRPVAQRAPARSLRRAAAEGGEANSAARCSARPAGVTRRACARPRWSTSVFPTGRWPIWSRHRREASLGRARGRGTLAEGAGEEEELNAQEVIRRMGLLPHPEGGFYRETFRSPTACARCPTGGCAPPRPPSSTC